MIQYEIFSDNHGKSVHSKICANTKKSTAAKPPHYHDSVPISDLIITASEAAELLNVTYRQVFTLIREHGLPAHNMGLVSICLLKSSLRGSISSHTYQKLIPKGKLENRISKN